MKSRKPKINESPHTPLTEVDGITVNGIPFASATRYREIYNRWLYQYKRTLRQKCSLEEQGAKIKELIEQRDSIMDFDERIMTIQDNAILYWNRQHDNVLSKLRKFRWFGIVSFIAFLLTFGYAVHCKSLWTIPLYDWVDNAVSVPHSHSPTYIQAY